jgi:pyruvate kinase
MDRIITEVEADPYYRDAIEALRPGLETGITDVIRHALYRAASVLPVKPIVTYTTSGSTGLRAARKRIPVPVLALPPRCQGRAPPLPGVGHPRGEDSGSGSGLGDRGARLRDRPG